MRPRSSPSPVWLKTTSRMTSMPAAWKARTISRNSVDLAVLAGRWRRRRPWGRRRRCCCSPRSSAAARRSSGLRKGQSSSSNSWTGSSSTAVTPSRFRYGIFSTRPANVPGCGDAGGRVAGEAADVQLVDDRVLQRRQRRRVLAPVERAADEQAAPRGAAHAGRWPAQVGAAAPAGAVGEGGRGRVEQDDAGVEAVAAPVRPVHAPAVAERRRQAGDQDVPVVAGAVACAGRSGISASGSSVSSG